MSFPVEPTVYAVDPNGHLVALSRCVGNEAAASKGASLKAGWRLATEADFAERKPKPIVKPIVKPDLK